MEVCQKCEKPAKNCCINCKSTFYCSKECQIAEWKNHKHQCRPFEVKSDEKFGRFLRAKRDIAKGDHLVSEWPLIIGPKYHDTDEEDETEHSFRCVGCFENLKGLYRTFQKCPSCNWPSCSSECNGLRNPELHDLECQMLKIGKGPAHKNSFKFIKDYYRSDVLIALKILVLQRKNPKKFKQIMDMESNEKKRALTSNFRESEEKILYLEENFLKPLQKAEEKSNQIILPQKDKKFLHKIFGILETNSMYISLKTGTEICGLYSTSSLFQHSCLPNVTYDFDMKKGFKINVKAARDIKKGEVLVTSYSHVLWPTSLREDHLRETKYFTCTCDRCKDPTELGTHFSTLRCIGTDEGPCNGYQLPTNPTALSGNEWACEKCPIKVSSENVNMITGRMSEEIDTILASNPSPAGIENFIEKLSPFLHANHHLFFNLKHTLLQLYGNHASMPYDKMTNDMLFKKLNLCNELQNIVDILDPLKIRISFYISIILYEKAQCVIEMQMRKIEGFNLKDAMEILEVAKNIISSEEDSSEGKQLIRKIESCLIKI